MLKGNLEMKKRIFGLLALAWLMGVVVGCSTPSISPLSPLQKQTAALSTPTVPYFPVRGNHEQDTDVHYIIHTIFPSYGSIIHPLDTLSVNYYVDWKNIRLIVVDQFSIFSRPDDQGMFSWLKNQGGDINAHGRKWVESLIESATNLDHVFIAFHEPAFPRHRHLHSSFNVYKEDRDAFWKMLVHHRDKVRAVFVAHTHYYSRMRVKDPAVGDAVDSPDQPGGIYQVDCGVTGRDSYRNTIVEVGIMGDKISYRTVQAKDANSPFHIIDEWTDSSNGTAGVSRGKWTFAVIGDNRAGFDSYVRALKEIRDLTVNPDPVFAPVNFVLACGDLDPVQENYETAYLKIFGKP